ncbi:MAG TPA: acyltransferase family protein [Rhodanobacteraceae bacterium]|nr:acyltransferase family protein [Rhodanobacteraceae bacterium]
MIRESAANWARAVYRPLRRAGRRALRKPVASTTRISRQPERYPALDNARFVLIALVVVGHLVEQLVDSGPFAAALYRWIYLFHMPAFVLVSGAVSKANLARRRVFALATGLLLPYLIFQTLYPAWDAWLSGSGGWSQGYLTPYWLLWYLVSLLCWRLLLPLFARLKFALPLAITIALAAGMVPGIGYPLSLSRTLVFFPLFLLGHRIGARRLQYLAGARAHKVGAALMLLAAAVGAWLLRDLDPEWLYASVDYAALQASWVSGAATRLALLVMSALCALAMVALVSRHARSAGFGRRSLSVYLVHGFLVLGLVNTGAFALLARVLPPGMALLFCMAAAFAIATLLSTRMVDRLAAPLIRPVRWAVAFAQTLARNRP